MLHSFAAGVVVVIMKFICLSAVVCFCVSVCVFCTLLVALCTRLVLLLYDI